MHLTRGLVPFWDDMMIDWRFTDATLSVNKPQKADVAFVCNASWEGNATDFFTVIRDDGKYRLYYEAWGWMDPNYPEGYFINVCYAESTDGLHWERPNLGMCEFRGSRDNNIIMLKIEDNFTVMRDDNPACLPEHRYKAVMFCSDPDDSLIGLEKVTGNETKNSLVCLVSSDGLHFTPYSVISRGYAYDTMNSLHWNPHTKKYYCYIREFHVNPDNPNSDKNETHVRGIRVLESEDFVNWSDPKPLNFMGGEDYPLYTNCVTAYPYDTRYYIGFPTRYVERKSWTPNYDRLCGAELRRRKMSGGNDPRMGLAITDCVFMSSRDNVNWYRFDEACITPGPEREDNWVYGDCYPALGGLIRTPSKFAGEPDELSIYVENRTGSVVQLDRYTYRIDGFASVKAGYKTKTLMTKPFTFDGDILSLNFRTSARGEIVMKIIDERGNTIDGYTTCPLFGDSIERIVDFEKPLAELAGKTVRFVFEMSDAELYAFRLS